MSNKIDGGQSAFDQVTDAAADFFGVGQKSDTCADAAPTKAAEKPEPPKQQAAQDDDVLDKLGDVAGDFWDDVTGSASKAAGEVGKIVGDAVDEVVDDVVQSAEEAIVEVADGVITTVEQVQQGVQETVIDPVEVRLDEIRTQIDTAYNELIQIRSSPQVLEAVMPGSAAIIARTERASHDFVMAMENLIESTPEDVVVDIATHALSGEWDIASDIAKTFANSTINPITDSIIELGDISIDAYPVLHKKNDEITTRFLEETITSACEFLSENRGDVEALAGLAVDLLDNDIVNFATTAMSYVPFVAPGLTVHSTVLCLANAVKDSPTIAQEWLNNPERIKAIASGEHTPNFSNDIKDLEVGQYASRKVSITPSFHALYGGKAGGGFSQNVARTGTDVYEIKTTIGGVGGLGVGKEALKKGASADVVAALRGELILEISGENAKEIAQTFADALAGSLDAWIRLKDIDMNKVRFKDATGEVNIGVEADASGINAQRGMGGAAGITMINGQPYRKLTASMNQALGIATPGLQVRDELSQDFLNDPKTGNPMLDILMTKFPDELVTGIKQAYGPSAMLKVGGAAAISVTEYKALQPNMPNMAELNIDIDLEFGRSTLKNNFKIVINDIEGLCRSVGVSLADLHLKLANGELSIQDLEKYGGNAGVFIEIKGPKSVLEQANLTVTNMTGLNVESGIITPTIISDPPEETDFLDNLIEALKPTSTQNTKLSSEIVSEVRKQQLGAHMQSARV